MTSWTEVTEQRYDEMLGVLPPAIYTQHGYLVGEPVTHNAKGQPVFDAFIRFRRNGYEFYCYFECDTPMTVQEFRKVKPQQVELDMVAEHAAKFFERLEMDNNG